MAVGMFYHAYGCGAFALSRATGYRVLCKHRKGGDILVWDHRGTDTVLKTKLLSRKMQCINIFLFSGLNAHIIQCPAAKSFCGGASQKIKARYVCKHPVPIMYGVYRLSALFLMFMGLSPAAIRLLPAAFNMVFCFFLCRLKEFDYLCRHQGKTALSGYSLVNVPTSIP